MTDRPDDESTLDPSRRRFLGGMAALGAGVTLSSYVTAGEKPPAAAEKHLTGAALDKALRDNVKTVVVIYAENRSFNNLFGNFPGVEKPLSSLKAADYEQRDRDGSLLSKLPPAWGGVLQVGPQSVDGVTYPAGVQFQENLPNAPFPLKGPNNEDLPLSLVTRDLWHVFYQNQMQINEGKNDRFVAWADSGGLTMGQYAQTQYSLRLWDVAKEFVLCDNFFQGAFGGSFLNHQYLISATAPIYPDAANSPAKSQIATLQSDNPEDPRLKPLDKSPASAIEGPPQFGPSAITPDNYAVNTLAPPYWPTWLRDPQNPN
ncbi:acid phosphatase, partial [Pseudomonas viridiflava]